MGKRKPISLLLKIILVNAAIFLVARIVGIVDIDSAGRMLDALVMPSSFGEWLHQPWTIVTYMFTQYEIPHILFNMLTFYWFGKIFTYRCSPRQLLALYLYGGIAGGATFALAAQISGAVTGTLIGSSAAVIAVVVAVAILMPNFKMLLLFIGEVKIKWIAVAVVGLLILSSVSGNVGPLAAHLGGIIAGAAFALLLARNVDITRPVTVAIESTSRLFGVLLGAFTRKKLRPREFHPGERAAYNGHTPMSEIERRENLDRILDKIKKSGYTALTADEKRFLFSESKKI